MSSYVYQSASTFTPTQISGCQLWLDASTAENFTFSSTSNISSWLDRSGSNNNFTAFNTPTHDATNKRVRFTSASTEYMSNATMNYNLSQRTIFIVMEEITNSIACGILSFVPNPNTGNDYMTTNGMTVEGNNGMRFYMNNGGYASDIGGPNPLSKKIFCDRMATTTGAGYVNGSNLTNVTANFTAGTSVGMLIGARWGGSSVATPYLNGYVYEILLFNVALSASDRQAIEGYLAWKWSLNSSLISSSPYKNRPPSFLAPFTNPIISQPTPLFTPTQLSNCVLWLDAADRSTLFQDTAGKVPCYGNGQSIALWRDKSVSGNNATNTTNQPTLLVNGRNKRNVVNFNGINQYFTLSTATLPTGTTQGSFFFVVNTNSSSVQVYFTYGADPNTTNRNPQFFVNTGLLAVDLYGGSGLTDTTNFQNSYLVESVIFSSTNAAWVNGRAFSGTPPAITLNTGTGWASLGVGRVTSTLSYYLSGQIAEMIIYNRALTTTERQTIEGYLAWKWGTNSSLDSAQPWKSVVFNTLPPFPNVTLPLVARQQRWLPTQLSSLSLWLDAADTTSVTTSGGNITAVTDKSGTGKTITISATVGYTPSNAFVFTNNTGVFNVSGMPSAPYDILTVATANSSSTNWRTLLRTGSTPGTHPFLLQNGTNNMGMWDGSQFNQFGSLTMTPSEKALVYVTMASGRTIQAAKNGIQSLTTATPAGNESIITAIGNLPLGAGGQPWGTLQELVICSTTLGLADRQNLEGYLAWKWGLVSSLPSTHPFKLFPPPA